MTEVQADWGRIRFRSPGSLCKNYDIPMSCQRPFWPFGRNGTAGCDHLAHAR